jgi:predicted nucleotidyltransferase component of viral defense system
MAETLERRIRAECERTGVLREVVEKDYAIGYVLAAMYGQAELASRLVFKGGTALRKAHFPDYRFSEDLDFTALPGTAAFDGLIQAAASAAADMLRAQGDFEVTVSRYPVRDPHPDGQEAFRIHIRFPWQGRSSCSLKVEITTDEPVLGAVVDLPLFHGYDERLASGLRCYALEEVVAEKLRALLQTRARLNARGWARPRSRDYYDLWQLLCVREGVVRLPAVAEMLPAKCDVRAVSFEGVDDFFDAAVIERARIDWAGDLRRMVPNPPDFDLCVGDVRERVSALLAGEHRGS